MSACTSRELRLFVQLFYSNADYGYRADWNPDKLTLLAPPGPLRRIEPSADHREVAIECNVVKEMICELRAVKPMREARRELQTRGQIEILPVDG